MLKTRLSRLALLGIVATLSTACVVDDPYYDRGPSGPPVYRGDPYRHDSRPSNDGYYRSNQWQERHGRDDRDHRDARRDARDARDARDDRHRPRPEVSRPPPPRPNPPPAQYNPAPRPPPQVHIQQQPPPRPAPPVPPPRTKSDRYNPKTGQYLPGADEMP